MITAGEILQLKDSKIVSVDVDTTVREAINIMIENKIGAITVEENGTIKGLLTERDLLRNILKEDFDLKKTKVGDCLLSKLHTAPITTSLFELQAKFLGLYTRHIFITHNEEILGLISAGDAIKTNLRLQNEEMKKLKSYVSMEYYEDWHWDCKKR